MRPRISPCLMSNVTWSRAVTPPKRIVTLSTSSSALRSEDSDIDRLPFQRVDLGLRRQGAPGPTRWQQALRPPDRQQHQRQAEEQESVVGEVAEPLGQVGDDRTAEDRAPAIA